MDTALVQGETFALPHVTQEFHALLGTTALTEEIGCR